MPEAKPPESKASMDPKFEKRLRDMQKHALDEFNKRSVGEQVLWYRPEDWDGVLTNFEGMAVPFDRSQANNDYVKAVQDPDKPGTTGDIAATTTMIDTLACLERATRQRYTRRPRAMAHLMGRKKGQSSPLGPFIQNYVEYVRAILQRAAQPQ